MASLASVFVGSGEAGRGCQPRPSSAARWQSQYSLCPPPSLYPASSPSSFFIPFAFMCVSLYCLGGEKMEFVGRWVCAGIPSPPWHYWLNLQGLWNFFKFRSGIISFSPCSSSSPAGGAWAAAVTCHGTPVVTLNAKNKSTCSARCGSIIIAWDYQLTGLSLPTNPGASP